MATQAHVPPALVLLISTLVVFAQQDCSSHSLYTRGPAALLPSGVELDLLPSKRDEQIPQTKLPGDSESASIDRTPPKGKKDLETGAGQRRCNNGYKFRVWRYPQHAPSPT
jgi:hypothetical protein